MKELFEHIVTRIKTVAAVNWVDFDLGQLEQQEPPVAFPCALVSFTNAQYELLAGLDQQAPVTIRVRCAFRVFERTHSQRQQSFRDVGLAHLDTLQAIHLALHGSEADGFSMLIRINFTTEPRADLRVYELTYRTLLYDCHPPQYTPLDEIVGAALPALCLDPQIIDEP